MPKLGLDGHAHSMRDLDDFAGLLDVLLVRQRGAIDHDRGEAGTDGTDNMLERTTVIEVQGKGNLRVTALIEASELTHLLYAEHAGNSQDNWRIELCGRLKARFHGETAVHVGGGNAVSALLGLLQKLMHRL